MIPLDSSTYQSSIDAFQFSTEHSCECAGHPAARSRVTGQLHRIHDNHRGASTKLERSRRLRRRRQPIDVEVSAMRSETEHQIAGEAAEETRWLECITCVTSSRRMTRSQMKLLGEISAARSHEPKKDEARGAVTDMPSMVLERRHSPDVATRQIDTTHTKNSRLPPDPRRWTRDDVRTWLLVHHAELKVDAERFPMNGKALCIMTIDMFNFRVPHAGAILHADFRRILSSVLTGKSTDTSVDECHRIER